MDKLKKKRNPSTAVNLLCNGMRILADQTQLGNCNEWMNERMNRCLPNTGRSELPGTVAVNGKMHGPLDRSSPATASCQPET